MSEPIDIDSTSMRALVEGFPKMLRLSSPSEAIIDSARALAKQGIQGVCLVGMGGSAISGDICKGLVRNVAEIPVVQIRDYGVPKYVDKDWVSIVVSYSGNTEETLLSFNEIRERRGSAFVITSGGKLQDMATDVPVYKLVDGIQPRAAVPLILSIVLPLIETLLGIPMSDLIAASHELERMPESWAKSGLTPNKVAHELSDVLPVFVGAEHLAPVAYRAKCQINENSKTPSFHSELPEANHNEIEAYVLYRQRRVMPVFLSSNWYDERVKKRIKETRSILSEQGVDSLQLESEGSTRLAETLGHVYRLDLASVEMAELRGVDPLSVPLISKLKKRV
ncbi:MAG: bifunctional phosphoglucose/phosphomannose isomerase [Candidatus Thorarchaeota archaeon]|nr:MAG: bifunctional phosphoglucose/phosphomannose isomerase [Candidatus Thorarchaeota archaeon]